MVAREFIPVHAIRPAAPAAILTRMHITFESPNQPEVIALIADLDAYHLTLYPPESVYALDLNALMQPEVKFAVARDVDGVIVGCGAVVLSPEYGEIKRMYVQPAARGQGLARRLMDTLEQAARDAGCPLMVLETGPSQPEAIALYQRHGFEHCGPYGGYPDDPHSVFMRKELR
jgi:putative acetyltransferase